MKDRIEKLRLLKRHYDIEYWRDAQTSQDDETYDQIVKELNDLLEQNPEYRIKEDDQLESVYMNTFAEVHHKNRMLSLDKALNKNEFKDWFKKTCFPLDRSNKVIFEAKIDGFAICLEYDKGVLYRASTRGDGSIGDDITATVFNIPDIPNKLEVPFTGEISGEIYMKQSSLIKLNEKMAVEKRDPFKNVRNAAAGIARQKDSSTKMSQYLSFLCYRLIDNEDNDYLDSINKAKQLGFNTVFHNLGGHSVKISDINDNLIDDVFDGFERSRESLDLDIDGVVIKLDSFDDQQKLGEKNRLPNWAIAYKFPPMTKITKLLDVVWELGVKDGRLTPMAVIDPVEIGGTLVKRPTLHNVDRIKQLQLKIGDTIKVSRRGDVIPHVEDVLIELRPDNCTEIKWPICPTCGTKGVLDGSYMKCPNENCQGKLSGNLNVFIKSMDIECLGPKLVDKLLDYFPIKDIADLYSLTRNDLLKMDRMGDILAAKIIKNIDNSKNEPLWKVIKGLSIPMVGETTAKEIEKQCSSLTQFKELKSITDLGEVVTNNILDWLSDENNQFLLDKMIEIGLGTTISISNEAIIGPLNGERIAFTGKLTHFTRNECKEFIVKNGGTPWDIKKGITILLIGEGAKDQKIEKAKKLGAFVLTEDKFLNKIN